VEFDELVTTRGTALRRLALMLCGDPHLADDLVQNTLVKAYRRWSRIAASRQPEAYVKAMIVNEHLSWWRRRTNREVPADIEPGAAPAAPDFAGAQASRDAAWTLLGELPARQRAVLVLRYYEDLPDAEIARVLGCGESTVRSQATRALATLRTLVPTLDEEALP
jgi:RNA polymerase sigma-70 factor (sigma-E family)